ncbi:hypothetical protein B9Z19DRAFT_675229 [Tuber borchii]|uniref:Uncharacterized protein n=1 Tax=Tuber borchii TaxID=42251 RepID=A0A2T6ZAD7_TUBBO|nr:hypothetical protein B9Z19DRAFT_675229 [Tuber borchii]
MGEWERRPFHKEKNKQKKQFKPKNFKSQKSRSKDLKNYYASRKSTGHIQLAAIVQCSAVQSEYRAYVLRESSAVQKECKPRIPVQIFIFIYYFSLACFPPLFLSLTTSRTSVCDLLLRSILHLHFVFLLRWQSGEVGNRGDAWADGSMAQQEQGGRGRENLCFLPFTYFFYFSSQVYICLWEVFSFFLRSF